MITALKSTHPLVTDVSLLISMNPHRRFISPIFLRKNLITEDIHPVREKLIALCQTKIRRDPKLPDVRTHLTRRVI